MACASLAILTLLTSVHGATTEVPRTWSRLDRDIETLSAEQSSAASGFEVSGWLRARGAWSSDFDADPVSTGSQDLSGFNVDSARVAFSGSPAPGYSVNVSIESGDPLTSDTAGPGVGLLDAYASVALDEHTTLSMGRYSGTFLWRTTLEERKLLFLDRSFIAEAWDGRDVGAELAGSFGRFDFYVGVQNGLDGAAEKLALNACACFSVLDNDLCLDESRLGLVDHKYLTFSLAWFDDPSLNDGTALGASVHAASGRWSAYFELVDSGDDLEFAPAMNTATGVVVPSAISPTGAQTPWSLMTGYLLVPDRWEIAARWQDLDDDDGTTIVTGAVDRYMSGHDAKWTLQLDSSDSDDSTLEALTVAIGLTVGV
jgi:hypothetical protein